MSDSSDVQLQLKKRARRRLIGAIAIAGLAAVVLPMVMDEEPKQQIQDVQIVIPGQDQAPLSPRGGVPNAAAAKTVAPAATTAEAPTNKSAEKQAEKAVEKTVDKQTEKPAEKPAEKKAEKAPEKAAHVDSPSAKPVDKPAPAKANDKAHDNGQYLILIGAFANPANVKQLQTKIGELNIKVITEPFDSPEGKKTRVRAGPFASREAADKALDKLKRIGVGGVVAARQ